MMSLEGYEACNHEARPLTESDLRRLTNRLTAIRHRMWWLSLRKLRPGGYTGKFNSPWNVERSLDGLCELLSLPLEVRESGCWNCGRRFSAWWCGPPCLECGSGVASTVMWCENTEVMRISFDCVRNRTPGSGGELVASTCPEHGGSRG